MRRFRFSESHRSYLITTVVRGRAPLFADFGLGRIVVRTLITASPHATTLAFVVMPDHLHWLLELGETQPLDRVIGDMKRISSNRVGKALGRSGGIWQSGFHDHAVRKEEDLQRAARYVVANPLRAGLVERLEDYPLWDAVWLSTGSTWPPP